jgi:hypothetical protein
MLHWAIKQKKKKKKKKGRKKEKKRKGKYAQIWSFQELQGPKNYVSCILDFRRKGVVLNSY